MLMNCVMPHWRMCAVNSRRLRPISCVFDSLATRYEENV